MNNREEFEIIKGFGQRKWDYDKMENYLKENKFFREIWADEIGLHPEDDFDRLIFNPYYMQLFQHGYAAGKTEQQKKIEREREEAENLIFEYCHEWYDFSPAEGNSYMYKKFVAYLEKTSGKTWEEIKEPSCKN